MINQLAYAGEKSLALKTDYFIWDHNAVSFLKMSNNAFKGVQFNSAEIGTFFTVNNSSTNEMIFGSPSL